MWKNRERERVKDTEVDYCRSTIANPLLQILFCNPEVSFIAALFPT
jgi:hypothetical protein